jgi:3(or 17)beta-hydroxysteroid dehydrogenase
MGRVSGKIAIVTGAASGLGRGIASLLAGEGAEVMATDINATGVKVVAEEIEKQGGEALFSKHDVASEDDWKKIVRTVVEHFGRLDVLVNCAGIHVAASVEETTFEKWRRIMSVNLDGVFLGTKYGAEAMKKTGGGSIINVSSTAGLIGTPNAIAYSASKGGVRLLTKAAAIEFSKAYSNYNIRVNSVHPGVIKSAMSAPLINDPVTNKLLLDWTPMGYFGEPEDIAYGVLYLASDESRFVTGAELVIDGGWTAC